MTTRAALEDQAEYLARSARGQQTDAQLAGILASVRGTVKDAWAGGRDEIGCELAAALRKLIDDGVIPAYAMSLLLAALEPLVPPGSVLYGRPREDPPPPGERLNGLGWSATGQVPGGSS